MQISQRLGESGQPLAVERTDTALSCGARRSPQSALAVASSEGVLWLGQMCSSAIATMTLIG